MPTDTPAETPPGFEAPHASRNPLKRLYNWILHWAETPYGVPALFVLSFAESSFFPIPPDVLLVALCLGLPRRWFWFATVCTVASVLGGLGGYGIGYFFRDSLGQWLLEWAGAMTIHGGAELAGSFHALAGDLRAVAGDHAGFAETAGRLRSVGDALAAGGYELTRADKALWLRAQALSWFNCPHAGVVLGPWAVAVAGLTPIPYKVFTVASGMFEMNVLAFTAASLVGRAARFYLVAAIIGLTYRFFGDRLRVFIDRWFNWLCVAFTLLLIGGFLLLRVLH